MRDSDDVKGAGRSGLIEDVALTEADIQNLTSLESLVILFARLGYNTNARVIQTVDALGISNDTLRSVIKRIELVARNQDSYGLDFEVYLIQVQSLRASVRNELVRHFRRYGIRQLLILTDTFRRYDFVMLESYTVELETEEGKLQANPLQAELQPNLRQLLFQIDLNKKDTRANRILSRFSWTESDAEAQYEKLLHVFQMATWSTKYFNNRALFSDYYLSERLPSRSEWQQERKRSSLDKAYRRLTDFYEKPEQYIGRSESWLRAQLLEPVLLQLGFVTRPVKLGEQPKLPLEKLPEQTLVLSAASESDQSAKPLALFLGYPWGRNLDGKDDLRDSLTPEANPGAEVVRLLDSGLAEWVVLTNGIYWRLYSANAHSRTANYYEMNLQEILELEPDTREEAFHYFWMLFKASSFLPTIRSASDNERLVSLLDEILIQSDLYARDLGDRLKLRVFEQIFPEFAEGFIQHARRVGLLPANLDRLAETEREALLKPYFTGTLTFLYRLLFLLYAESRELLPMRHEPYYAHSLESLKQRIAQHAGSLEDQVLRKLKGAYSKESTELYESLQELFTAVDKGNPELNVPVYNGGLFMTNPPPQPETQEERELEPVEFQVARFLLEQKIPDYYLALGLDRMTRDVDEKLRQVQQTASEVNTRSHALAFIDYKSLGVRHLGSIYEGVLEFKLRLAVVEMAVVKKGKDSEQVIPFTEAVQKGLTILKERQSDSLKDRLYGKGEVYLVNEGQERKMTGSYYTPDYIVKYIVSQTVGPILKEKLEGLRPLFREAQKELAVQNDLKVNRGGGTPEHEVYKKYRTSLNESFFDLKVLDPAMGSGHFLVEVVDYITDELAKLLSAFKWSPIVYELAETRAEILKEMDRQQIEVQAEKLNDLNLLKRRVLKSCIYGVDLNPMAVELAKVSLWLDCFTLGAPLSFLDHHLKCGNSLIGAKVEVVRKEIKDSLFGYQFSNLLEAANLMRGVSKRSDVTASEVAESRDSYYRADDAMAPYKRLFNVWLSEYYDGGKGAQKTVITYADQIVNNTYMKINPKDRQAVLDAKTLYRKKRFFHWELEFPEVFFDETERKPDAGFDAVVGNPPYVRQEGLSDDKPAFKELYSVYNAIADLYTYFIEGSQNLLRQSGRFGMITSNKFMRANYGAALRAFLTDTVALERLVDFGDLPVFGEATAYPIIIEYRKSERQQAPIAYALIENLTFKSLPEVVNAQTRAMPASAFAGSNWSLAASLEQAIIDKLKVNSVKLGIYTGGEIRRGILTGFNEAFVIDRATRDRLIAEDANSGEIIKPLVVGKDIRRYTIDFQDLYLIWTYIGVPIKKYPAIYRHLQQYQPQLEKRTDQGNYWWELRHCDYYAEFEKPKIIYPVIAVSNKFTFDTDKCYSNDKTFIIPTEDLYLLALLNSKALFTFFLSELSGLRGGFLEYRAQTLIHTPIRKINFTTPAGERKQALKQSKALYQEYLGQTERMRWQALQDFTKERLTKLPEEADVLYDLLSFLAEEMLRLKREQRTAQQSFLRWLEGSLRIQPDSKGRTGIDVLTNKTKLLEFVGDYQKDEPALEQDDLWEIIRQNRTRLGVLPSLPGLKEQVQERYRASLRDAAPLKEALWRTNWMIDQLVYRLYGLSEEEIDVVEGVRLQTREIVEVV